MSNDFVFSSKTLCKCCTEEIFSNGNVLIQCVECTHLELCVECFANRAEIGEHRSYHSYRVIDNGSYPLLQSSWFASYHLKLLEAVEQYGYGNWEDISKYLNVSSSFFKTPAETKEEYISVFISGLLGQVTWKEESRGHSADHTESKHDFTDNRNEPPSSLSVEESIMLGYMPRRDDFEVEYNNLAESLVSQLDVGNGNLEEEEEIDLALKLAHIDIYKHKLREREKRKTANRNYGLIAQYFKTALHGDPSKRVGSGNIRKLSSKSPSDYFDRLKVFSEFSSSKEHQFLIESLSRERELKTLIIEYQKYRRNGMTKISESVDFDSVHERLSRSKINNSKHTGDQINGISCKTNISKFALTLLSSNEKKLISDLKLSPLQYMSIKTSLLMNYPLKKKGALIGLDKNNRTIIFNFLLQAGWIKTT